MSQRVLNSRFSRRRTRGHGAKPSAPTAGTTAPTTAAAQPVEVPPIEAPAETLNIRFGYIMLYDKLTVLEVCEEVWGNKRYFAAALSEDPSLCIKALTLEEAIYQLVRHLVMSPTIRRYYLDQPPDPAWHFYSPIARQLG
jgi:hypothetical protein